VRFQRRLPEIAAVALSLTVALAVELGPVDTAISQRQAVRQLAAELPMSVTDAATERRSMAEAQRSAVQQEVEQRAVDALADEAREGGREAIYAFLAHARAAGHPARGELLERLKTLCEKEIPLTPAREREARVFARVACRSRTGRLLSFNVESQYADATRSFVDAELIAKIFVLGVVNLDRVEPNRTVVNGNEFPYLDIEVTELGDRHRYRVRPKEPDGAVIPPGGPFSYERDAPLPGFTLPSPAPPSFSPPPVGGDCPPGYYPAGGIYCCPVGSTYAGNGKCRSYTY
jgi:hypothetical protein